MRPPGAPSLGYTELFVVYDTCLIFSVVVLNAGLIIFVLCGRTALPPAETLAVALLSAAHLPVAFIVTPLRILTKFFPSNFILESCSIVITISWLFNDVTILAATFFCFFQIFIVDNDSGGILTLNTYRKISFGLLIIIGLITLVISCYLCSHFSIDIYDNCILNQSSIVTTLFVLTAFITPLLLVLMHYFNNESIPNLSLFFSSRKSSNLQKENSGSLTSMDKAPLYRKLFFTKVINSHSSQHSISFTETDMEHKLIYSNDNLDENKNENPNKNPNLNENENQHKNPNLNENENQHKNPNLNENENEKKWNNSNLSKKCLHFDVNTFKAKLTPERNDLKSPSIVGKLILIYFIFWIPYFACQFVVLISYVTLYDHTFWTSRLAGLNSIAIAIVLRLYIRTVGKHHSALETVEE